MSNDESDETHRIHPGMLAKRARDADIKVQEEDQAARENELKETPKAPPVYVKELDAMGPHGSSVPREGDGETPAPPKMAKPAAPVPPSTVVKEPGLQAWALRNIDHLIGAGIGLVYVLWLLGTARDLGFSRDEGFYFSASGDYERWFKVLLSTPGHAFERSVIDPIWASNHEHPSLMKSLFALSHMFLYEKWKIFSDQSTAFRFPGMVSMGVAMWVTYLFGAKVYSRRAGVVAAILLGLMPNVFYHAHLACFDVPIMAMWILCIYVYWTAERTGGIKWAIIAGVVYGLTLETKHNAWMLPAVFLPHAIIVHGRALTGENRKKLRLPASLLAMAIIGPIVFVALWPWLWNDTVPRIQEYVNFHLHHDYYNIEFLGVTYFAPPSPRSYMPVMIAATVPTTTLVLFVLGAFDRLKPLVLRFVLFAGDSVKQITKYVRDPGAGEPYEPDLLIVLSLAVPLAAFLLPRTPIFGGTKHWITAYPALALFAGRGFDLVWNRLELLLRDRLRPDHRQYVLSFVGALLLLAPFAITRHSHPFGLSAYVPFFGGTAGGADLGLNRQFWGFTTESLDPWFRDNTKPGDTVYIMDTAWSSWQRMVDEKRIPPWLRGVGSPAEAELSIVHHEQHINEIDYNIWTEYGTDAPEYVLTHDGVPIISVYRRPKDRPRGARHP